MRVFAFLRQRLFRAYELVFYSFARLYFLIFCECRYGFCGFVRGVCYILCDGMCAIWCRLYFLLRDFRLTNARVNNIICLVRGIYG